MTTLLDRFLTSFRNTDRGIAEPPGLVQNEDGTVDYVKPDVSFDTPGASLVLWSPKAGDLVLDLFVITTTTWDNVIGAGAVGEAMIYAQVFPA